MYTISEYHNLAILEGIVEVEHWNNMIMMQNKNDGTRFP